MYTVAVTKDFIANHYLVGGDWGSENSPHAHHYVAEISIEAAELDQHGYLVDIVEIESALDAIVADFRDSMLNDKPEFAGLNPSIEHFSRIICERLLAAIKPPGSGSMNVKLWENATCWAAYKKAF
ncbi:MAG: 6-pyruvoyl tetrahydropterin synthase [Gammaproteobacteria bacterium]|nr:6-pyruvoyl tetrahydropterin synthase [Gammaproteobacteria bacterium]MBC55220.1 6-pyruvoyl tetrahydropterin synthase [Gammaproteobacteria bacterium]|tara:strand:- start:205 stop:582 length:378 start_codon:yes stop_codon:yes gene_type:complete